MTRHGLWDRAVRGDIYANLRTSSTLHIYWQHALDRTVLAANEAYVELSQGMGEGWVSSVFFRQMSFTNVRADFYGVGFDKYVASWLIRARFSLADVRDRRNPVIQAQVRYYISGIHTFFSLNGGYGEEVIVLDAVGSVQSISNAAIGAYFQAFLGDHLGLGVGVNYADTKVLPNRGGGMIRLLTIF